VIFVAREDEGEVLLVAAEDKKITAYEVYSDTKLVPKPIAEFVGHGNRSVSISIAGAV